MCNSCNLICCNMAICVKCETYLLKYLWSLQDIYWLMTYPQICLISCVLSTKLSAQLWPLHLEACWVVTFLCTSLPGCSLVTCPPAWMLSSSDMSTCLPEQLWLAHQPGSPVSCVRTLRYHRYYLISIIMYLSTSEWNEAPLSSAVA